MDWIQDYLWAPLVPLALYLWRMIHGHDKDIETCMVHIESVDTAITDAKQGRKEIYDKIESVRTELTEQHATLRADQRQDFKEIRKAIANISK